MAVAFPISALFHHSPNSHRHQSLTSATASKLPSPILFPVATARQSTIPAATSTKSPTPSALDSALVLLSSLVLSFSLSTSPVSAFVVTTPRKLQPDELATVRLFKENTPSVVYITNIAVRQDVFTLDVLEVPQGSGSGFVWDKNGHIVTNFHVIRGASDLRVTLSDQSTYNAKVIGFDQDKDVAVLRIDAPKDKLRPLLVGASADLLVGQKVYAIGNPGLQPTKRDKYGRLILGDIITSVNGKKVANGSDLYRIMDQCKVGDTVLVEILRGDHKEKIPVVLEPKPDES